MSIAASDESNQAFSQSISKLNEVGKLFGNKIADLSKKLTGLNQELSTNEPNSDSSSSDDLEDSQTQLEDTIRNANDVEFKGPSVKLTFSNQNQSYIPILSTRQYTSKTQKFKDIQSMTTNSNSIFYFF
jgi:hypothetical protein